MICDVTPPEIGCSPRIKKYTFSVRPFVPLSSLSCTVLQGEAETSNSRNSAENFLEGDWRTGEGISLHSLFSWPDLIYMYMSCCFSFLMCGTTSHHQHVK